VTVDDVAHNLPVALSSFVGRDDEVEEVGKLLGESRLLTLTGMAGIGKTRLALEVASHVQSDYPDGAWLVELAPLADPAVLPRAVAAALSVRESPGRTVTEGLVAHLRDRCLLLVLDNCEHLLGPAAELADTLLGACAELTVLATSREPLAIPGEVAWQVPALAVPDPGGDAPPEALAGYAAVRLFLDRAADNRSRTPIAPEALAVVAHICCRLDGIALAIELAAARAGVLSLGEIADRLDDRFGLLTAGSRIALPRHQTLLAALDWSHELLSVGERVLLRRLSVFAGGFTLGAVEAVCSGDEVARPVVLDLLARLVMRSLVVAETTGTQTRYRLLETIRAYAHDRLVEAGEQTWACSRHARWCVELAERAEPELTGPDQQPWLDRLEADHENLRGSLEWAIDQDDPEVGLRLAGALVLFWRIRGYISEGRMWLDQVVGAGAGGPAPLRAKAVWGAGFLAHMMGDSEVAIPLLEESLSLWTQLDDDQGRARALLLLGNCWQYRDPPTALELLRESIVLARRAGDLWCLAHGLALCGLEHAYRNDLDAARPYFEECLVAARQADDKQGLRAGLIGLGSVALRQGDYTSAEILLREALAVAVELGEDYGRAIGLRYLGEVAIGIGDYGRAAELLDEALVLTREMGDPSTIVQPLTLLGRLEAVRGEVAAARRHFEEALALAPPTAGRYGPAVHGLAELAWAEGDARRARALFEEALALAQASGDKGGSAQALHGLGNLARAEGDGESAASLHQQALQLHRAIRNSCGIAASLEAVAGLAVRGGRVEHAARLLAAAQAIRDRTGCARPPVDAECYAEDMALVREGLGPEAMRAAWAEGEGLTVDEAVAAASRGRGRRVRPSSGWASLTNAEQQVVALVAEGLTNPEIAARLFVSLGTVKAHLSHVFAKLGLTERRELGREFRRRQDQPTAAGK